jgi:hypothetical protein
MYFAAKAGSWRCQRDRRPLAPIPTPVLPLPRVQPRQTQYPRPMVHPRSAGHRRALSGLVATPRLHPLSDPMRASGPFRHRRIVQLHPFRTQRIPCALNIFISETTGSPEPSAAVVEIRQTANSRSHKSSWREVAFSRGAAERKFHCLATKFPSTAALRPSYQRSTRSARSVFHRLG